MADSYRVHVYADGGRGPWLASADFTRRPQSGEIAAAIPALREPGWYEVRVNPVDRDGTERSGWAWTQDAAPERVIFRKFLDHKDTDMGDGIIALFPDIAEDEPGMVLSYMHIGQHGPASMRLIGGEPRTTRPARPEEYAALETELESGPYWYKLAVIQRTPRATNQPRNIQARKRESLHMASCPRCGGAGTRRSPCICPKGGANPKQGRRATSAKCGCSCGHQAGDVINGVEQRWGGGCTGAKAGDPHAAHCGRPTCGQ